jgi:hypothetical protein
LTANDLIGSVKNKILQITPYLELFRAESNVFSDLSGVYVLNYFTFAFFYCIA